MKTIKKNVYWCDFCKKRGLSASAMMKHEKHCTGNAKRECRVCGGGNVTDIVEKFKTRFALVANIFSEEIVNDNTDEHIISWIGEPITMEEVREAADNCPACILTIIRQCKFGYHYFHDQFKFDFRKELSEAMVEKNRERSEQENYY